MKITWEPSDIKCGQRVRKPGCVETWMIGYNPSLGVQRYCYISLADGMISRSGLSQERLALHLNDTEVQPIELVGTSEAGNG